MPERPTLNKVLNIRLREYSKPSGRRYGKDTRDIGRGLHHRTIPITSGNVTERVYVSGYDTILPSFEGQDLEDIVNQRIRDGKTPVRILDVGCGRGNFLLDCKTEWGDKVEGYGVSAHPLHKQSVKIVRWADNTEGPTESLLTQTGITVAIGDAQSLTTTLNKNGIKQGFDLVTSVFMFNYLADQLAALKGIYNVLKDDGIALLSDCNLARFDARSSAMLEDYLRESYQFEFELAAFSFRKTHPRLFLPVRYQGLCFSEVKYELDYRSLAKLRNEFASAKSL